MLRERIKALESRVAEMVRNAQENDAISSQLVTWTRALLLQEDASRLPETVVATMKNVFSVPHCALRLWSVRPQYAALECARPVTADTVSLANSMRVPFCGSNVGFEAATWFEDATSVQSLAMLPLRVGADPGHLRSARARVGRQGPFPHHDGHDVPRADRGARERRAGAAARLGCNRAATERADMPSAMRTDGRGG